jgi:hypothetical protein
MRDNRPVSRGLVLATTLLVASCGPQPPSRFTVVPTQPISFVIPTILPNGRVEITIRAAYAIGSSATIPVRLIASRGSVAGPIAARILASGIPKGGRPSEVLVATLTVSAVSAKAGQTAATSVTWNGRDDKNEPVAADAYSLVMDFRLEDGSLTTTGTAGATLQWNAP